MLRTKTELFLGELPPRDRPAGIRVGVVRSDRWATLLTAVSCNVTACKGTWSLHVTRIWRMTFRIEDDEIADLDLEDYHYGKARHGSSY